MRSFVSAVCGRCSFEMACLPLSVRFEFANPVEGYALISNCRTELC